MKTNRVISLLLLVASEASRVSAKARHVPSSISDRSEVAFGSDQSVFEDGEINHEYARNDYLDSAIQALDVMQARFFELWIGTWPTAIDWTAAVVNTHVSALLGTLARYDNKGRDFGPKIHQYFPHNIAYYFGEEAVAIRNEAYDDMLWVVLEYIQSIKFISYRNITDPTWHGTQFIPAFSHRARIFWDLASKGWDTSLCDGGMIWNPRLTPYKNAITNQLFISASVNMYLYFPGDTNTFPFMATDRLSTVSSTFQAYDRKHLDAAIDGYTWLKNSNMTNTQGLYVDGYHVLDWGVNGTVGTGKCDERNEVVYTYNQGVVLTGLRGLWESTGDQAYLDDGYELVRNVMKSTGWMKDGSEFSQVWAGLGQAGILEELCDRRGSCSQDAQTFKGIFFQHLTDFCMPLPLEEAAPGKTYSASKSLAALHESNCLAIGSWVAHNAKAALRSRDREGKFGMWWGQPSVGSDHQTMAPGSEDYRNNAAMLALPPWSVNDDMPREHLQKPRRSGHPSAGYKVHKRTRTNIETDDFNDRGRGRTVETQSGGLAVLRAAWEMARSRT